MKRYFIFAGNLAARGGWDDFRHEESELLEAAQVAQRYEWAQVVDTAQKKIVFSGKRRDGKWVTSVPLPGHEANRP